MADYDYLPINDDEMLPGRPVKTSLAFRWRNNAIAMIQGGVNAPRIHVDAFPTPASAGFFLRGCAHRGYGGAVAESGTLALVPDPEEYDADSGFRYYVHKTGVYAIKIGLLIDPDSTNDGDVYAQVYVNGAPYGTLRNVHSENGISASGAFVENLTLTAGTVVELYARWEESGATDPTVVQVAWGIACDHPYNWYLTKILEIII